MKNDKPEDDEIPQLQRLPSPPPHTTFATRQIHPPSFSAFKPRDYRFTGQARSMSHVAWSCDGKRIAAVGLDKMARVWNADKQVRLEPRLATLYSGTHTDEVNYVSWNPTHPDMFCTSSVIDRRIVFWDARQKSRSITHVTVPHGPIMTNYSPDGKHLLYTYYKPATDEDRIAQYQVSFLANRGTNDWEMMSTPTTKGSRGIFSNAGDAVIVAHTGIHSLDVYNFPEMSHFETVSAHVGGSTSIAMDPRGRYLASGGLDAIVNLFDLDEWICARTVTSCDHSINTVSFSFDGEYLAMATAGSYIDICATETAAPLHRVASPGPAPTVAWHPSQHAIAYCSKPKVGRENPASAFAYVSTFGVME
ncbi:WD40 repeat-like protein [Schizophyllum commune Loenen D]|nr:WD40 repeat-like protein [Schizophyllum commune Loenen D]